MMRWFWRRGDDISLPQLWKRIAELPMDGLDQITPLTLPPIKPLKAKVEHELIRLLKRRSA